MLLQVGGVRCEILVTWAMLGCGDPSWGTPVPMADPDLWRAWSGADPFGEQGDRYCDPLAWGPADFGSERVFDVWTQQCAWVTVGQLTLVELGRRDQLHVTLFHDPLTGPADAEARVGLALAGEIVWEEAVPIPSDSQFLLADLELKRRYPAGTELLFHIDNHGSNSYHLILVGAAPRE